MLNPIPPAVATVALAPLAGPVVATAAVVSLLAYVAARRNVSISVSIS